MRKTILIFSTLTVLLLLLFEVGQWNLYHSTLSLDAYLVIAAVAFITVGVVLQRLFSRDHNRALTQVPYQQVTDLTRQEFRVLELMAQGHSNQEIAQKLHVAISTVKSHVSKVLNKLSARRRSEAIKIGRDLRIIS